jgi:4'-phosphopantetheinyl transferase
VVEGGGLENRCARKGTGGSNPSPSATVRQTGDVHVWFQRTGDAPAAAVAAGRTVLSDEERARADRFHRAEDRRDYTLAHALLRRHLSAGRSTPPGNWVFRSDPAGKPHLAGDAELSFSLSHTHQLVACAVGSGIAVGIDVEQTTRPVDVDAISTRYFAPAEAHALAHCPPGERLIRFIELWTLKEAVAKAIGAGLAMPLGAAVFAFDAAGSLHFEPPSGHVASDWHIALYEPEPGARLGVAIIGATGRRLIVQEVDATGTVSEPLRPLRRSTP